MASDVKLGSQKYDGILGNSGGTHENYAQSPLLSVTPTSVIPAKAGTPLWFTLDLTVLILLLESLASIS